MKFRFKVFAVIFTGLMAMTAYAQIPSLLTAERMNRLTPEQFRQLTPAQIQGLPEGIIAALKPELLAAMTEQQVNALLLNQIVAMTPLQVGSLKNFGSLSGAQIGLLNPDVIAALAPEQLNALPAEVFSLLSPVQIAAVTQKQATEFGAKQLSALNQAQWAAINSSAFNRITTPSKIASISPTSFNQMLRARSVQLIPDAYSWFTAEQIASIDAEVIPRLNTQQLSVLLTQGKARLNSQQEEAITLQQFVSLDIPALKRTNQSKIASVPLDLIPDISPAKVQLLLPAMTTNQIERLNKLQTESLPDATRLSLSAAQIAALDGRPANGSQYCPQLPSVESLITSYGIQILLDDDKKLVNNYRNAWQTDTRSGCLSGYNAVKTCWAPALRASADQIRVKTLNNPYSSLSPLLNFFSRHGAADCLKR